MYFCGIERKMITCGGYFERFMATLTEKEQIKNQHDLLLVKTQDRIPKKFIKSIRDGLYGLRTEYEPRRTKRTSVRLKTTINNH